MKKRRNVKKIYFILSEIISIDMVWSDENRSKKNIVICFESVYLHRLSYKRFPFLVYLLF